MGLVAKIPGLLIRTQTRPPRLSPPQADDGGQVFALAQTPGPDLACQDAVMENEAFISSESSCISTSRRTRAS